MLHLNILLKATPTAYAIAMVISLLNFNFHLALSVADWADEAGLMVYECAIAQKAENVGVFLFIIILRFIEFGKPLFIKPCLLHV